MPVKLAYSEDAALTKKWKQISMYRQIQVKIGSSLGCLLCVDITLVRTFLQDSLCLGQYYNKQNIVL